MKKLNIAITSLCTFLMLASFAVAQQAEEENSTVPTEQVDEQQPTPQTEDQTNPSDQDTKVTNEFNPRFTSHQRSNHHLVALSEFGDQIILEDDSYWLVRPEHLDTLQYWSRGDRLAITQASRNWFRGKDEFQLAIFNLETGTFVEVKCSLLPDINNIYTMRIIDFRLVDGEICLVLNDGTYWPLKEKHRYIWERWYVNEFIVIGTNDTWNPWWNDTNVLINVSCAHNGASTFITSTNKKF